MESLYLLIPLSLLFLALIIGVLFWAVHSGQYDDLDREGERILFDDDLSPSPSQKGTGSVAGLSDQKAGPEPETTDELTGSDH